MICVFISGFFLNMHLLQVHPNLLHRPYRHARQTEWNQALKARCSTAQGGGREAAVTLGWHEKDTSPVRAAQSASPLQGLI
jgi:hypothetical protein